MARGSDKDLRLKLLCFRAVRDHFSALGSHSPAVLPTALLEELLPHLTVCQLDELQPALNNRGVSTYCAWMEILGDMWGSSRVMDIHTEEEAKHEVMKGLFSPVLYGFKNDFIIKNASNLNTASFLRAAAKCIKHLVLINSYKPLKRLTCEQRLGLDLLEKHISSVSVSHTMDLSKPETQLALLVLHRLLDHGQARRVVIQARCPLTLSWILYRRGSQSVSCDVDSLTAAWGCDGGTSCHAGEEQVPSCKRLKLGEGVCDGVSSAACPRGHIESLEVRQCQLDCFRVLSCALPSWSCLKSLTLHSLTTFKHLNVLDLSRALQQLSGGPSGGLSHLSVSTLPCCTLMEQLLDACPSLLSLSVEILYVPEDTRDINSAESLLSPRNHQDIPLQKLSVKLAQQQTDVLFIASVLRRCPQLCSLHLSGFRLPHRLSLGPLLSTVAESCRCVRILSLEDMNLLDCLPHIVHLLQQCQLQELCLNDCRLLEKWTNKEEGLRQLVSALTAVASLHTLSLAQNRIARYVPVLAQLFSGPSLSALKRLDLSLNFIQPAELLEFSHRLSTHRPPHRLTLDLRKNPGDRDPDMWTSALNALKPFCLVLLERWKSTDTMVDHISNM